MKQMYSNVLKKKNTQIYKASNNLYIILKKLKYLILFF